MEGGIPWVADDASPRFDDNSGNILQLLAESLIVLLAGFHACTTVQSMTMDQGRWNFCSKGERRADQETEFRRDFTKPLFPSRSWYGGFFSFFFFFFFFFGEIILFPTRKGKEWSVQRGKTNPKNGVPYFMCTLFH